MAMITPADYLGGTWPGRAEPRPRRRDRSDRFAAIAITGKPFMLAAGADLTGFAKIVSREQALAIARIGHAVFDKLHTSPVPTFAFINGLALGGGLELTLHCHYRTVSAAASGIALPECFTRPVPGLGRVLPAAQPDRCRPGRPADHREPTEPEQDAEWRRRRTSSAWPTPSSTAPISWLAHWTGRVSSWPVR